MSLLLTGFEWLEEIGINMWLGGVGSLVSMIWLSSWNCNDEKRQHTLKLSVTSNQANNCPQAASISLPLL